MTDPVIRPGNSLLLIGLQTAEGSPATLNATDHVVLAETDSIDFNGPFRGEATNEANGSFAASAPLVMGQPATISFRAKLHGAGQAYTSSVKPPLHAALSACGWMGQFTAAIAAAALTAGTTTAATLPNGFAATAQLYRGMPLILSGAVAPGRMPLITNYTAGRVATLSDEYGSALTVGTSAALPANWLYAPTTPKSAAERTAMHPAASISLYRDGMLWTWGDCRGTFEPDGTSGKAGYGMFSFTGIFLGRTDADMLTGAVFAGQSAPLLNMGAGVAPAFQVNRRSMPIQRWSLKANSQPFSPDDPNTPYGFGAGQIAERSYALEIDPMLTRVAARDAIAEIAALSQYPAAIQIGQTAGNRVSMLTPQVQPMEANPGRREKVEMETIRHQALNPGRDSAGRDGDVSICFS